MMYVYQVLAYASSPVYNLYYYTMITHTKILIQYHEHYIYILYTCLVLKCESDMESQEKLE